MLLPLLLLLSTLQLLQAFPLAPSKPLHRRRSRSPSCDPSTVLLPNATGFSVPEGESVVAVAVARGTQNYTCTFGQQMETGVLALLFDVTCLAANLSTVTSGNESSTTSSSSAPSSTASSSVTSTTLITQATASSPSAAAFIPLDNPSLPQPVPSLPPLDFNNTISSFNLSLLPLLALSVPFPYNASTFPYLIDPTASSSSGTGLLYYISPPSSSNETTPVPFFSLPPYGSFTAASTSQQGESPAPMNETTTGAGGKEVENLSWRAYDAVRGGSGGFALHAYRVDTAGGGLVEQNCTTEGATLAVDFAALFYFTA
ncbi:hypothetical protein JCM8547_004772 [Rhodosporidiobolus lusitaniae]